VGGTASEAGDLASQVTNLAAQLIARGKRRVVHREGNGTTFWFDVMMMRAANLVGLAAGRKCRFD